MQQVAIKTKLKAIVERLDDVIIAEMIAKRFHGPFVSGKELLKRIEMLQQEKNKYVQGALSSTRSG